MAEAEHVDEFPIGTELDPRHAVVGVEAVEDVRPQQPVERMRRIEAVARDDIPVVAADQVDIVEVARERELRGGGTGRQHDRPTPPGVAGADDAELGALYLVGEQLLAVVALLEDHPQAERAEPGVVLEPRQMPEVPLQQPVAAALDEDAVGSLDGQHAEVGRPISLERGRASRRAIGVDVYRAQSRLHVLIHVAVQRALAGLHLRQQPVDPQPHGDQDAHADLGLIGWQPLEHLHLLHRDLRMGLLQRDHLDEVSVRFGRDDMRRLGQRVPQRLPLGPEPFPQHPLVRDRQHASPLIGPRR